MVNDVIVANISIPFVQTKGRNKRGAIYTFAAGNGGLTGDGCAYTGYVSSICTIAINGVNKDGSRPRYAGECPGIMATTYSSVIGGGIVSGMGQYSL